MKSWIILSLLSIASLTSKAQSVGINTDGSAPHSSAIFDIKSNNKGLLAPRMSSAERAAIAAPAKGLIVFDNTTSSYWFFNGAAWVNQQSMTLPFSATENSAVDVYAITNNGTGAALTGRNNGNGRAGIFEILHANNMSNALEVTSNSIGNAVSQQGNAGYFELSNPNSVGSAVRAKVSTSLSTIGAAAVYGEAAGTGGSAGVFYASNPAGESRALYALTKGNGTALYTRAEGSGDAIEALMTGTGRAAYLRNNNPDNPAHTLMASSNSQGSPAQYGSGAAGYFEITNPASVAPAIHATVNTPFGNLGAAAVFAESKGTGGAAAFFYQSNTSGNGDAIIGLTKGNGDAISAYTEGYGNALYGQGSGDGLSLYAYKPSNSTGGAALFQKMNSSLNDAVFIIDDGLGSALRVLHTGAAGNILKLQSGSQEFPTTVARVNKNGRGFFNDGTQVGGADLAEAFNVTGDRLQYETGDVLVIATGKDRAVERSAIPYSNLVAGVYATKPGVLLTEEHIDSDLSDKVPMGVIGVIPTKVCLEGGAIRRGDMLVTSSLPGVAMKADLTKVKTGQVIGKALQDYEGQEVGKINVLVSVK